MNILNSQTKNNFNQIEQLEAQIDKVESAYKSVSNTKQDMIEETGNNGKKKQMRPFSSHPRLQQQRNNQKLDDYHKFLKDNFLFEDSKDLLAKNNIF